MNFLKKIINVSSLLMKIIILKPALIRTLISSYQKRKLVGLKITLLFAIDKYHNDSKSLSDKTKNWQVYQKKSTLLLAESIIDTLNHLSHKPLISIVLPTYNTPIHYLDQAIQSVLHQHYPHWELCIVDDASTLSATQQLLSDYQCIDERIHLQVNTTNLKVSATTNRAIKQAKGEYIVFMDHDDILEPQALLRIAEVVSLKHPDFIYSDEILISQDGQHVLEFYFRPTFSKERLRGHPYIVHLLCFNAKFLKNLGGLDENLAISQDYDLILRATEKSHNIVHIPEILYQWRRVEFSSGHLLGHQVMEVSTEILQRHLQRCGEDGSVYGQGFFNFFEVRYVLPKTVKVAIIIPTKNQYHLLKSCLETIERTTMDINYDIVIINHQSDDQQTLDYLQFIQNKNSHPQQSISQNPSIQTLNLSERSIHYQVLSYCGDFNFSKMNNDAVKQLGNHYTHLLFCNNNIQAMDHNWLSRMMELFSQQDVGAVGAKLVFPEVSKIQHAGVNVGVHHAAEHYAKFMHDDHLGYRTVPIQNGSLIINCDVLAVTAACMLVNKKIFDQVGGFDEQLAVGFGDTDLSLKIHQAGYRVIFCPNARLIHHESVSRGVDNKHPEDTALFKQKWQRYMNNHDPYYNPNLSPTSFSWEEQNPLPVYRTITDIIN
jgi:glycosyltransferase involved in cell wall biosynthesis